MSHQPGEAALCTAGALIDGLGYERVKSDDKAIQAARFGETLMAWTSGKPASWPVTPKGPGPWLIVDVVGRAKPLPVDAQGNARLELSASPVYILTEANYQQLTRAR